MRTWFKSEMGFTLIEVLLATILFSLIAMAFAASYMNGSILTTNTGHRQEALALAESGADQYKVLGYGPVLSLINTNTGIPSYWHMGINNVKFLRTIKPVCVDSSNFSQTVTCPAITTTPGTIRLDITVASDDKPAKFEPVLLYTVLCT